jgi:hypothetical protein
LKNLRADVTKACLLGIFFRFQRGNQEKFVLPLMHQGRMKGQAFVTFLGIYVFHLHKKKMIFRIQVQVVYQIWPFVPMGVL